MKKILIVFTGLILGVSTSFAQIGIGSPVPDVNSLLDLTNNDNRGLVLPDGKDRNSLSTQLGMMNQVGDLVFCALSSGFQVLSPWKHKFNGDVSNHVFYIDEGNLRIGDGEFENSDAPTIQLSTSPQVSLNDHGAFMIGAVDSINMVWNGTEIQTRKNGAANDLILNEQGGQVHFGQPGSEVDLKVSDKVQEIHKPTGEVYNVVPTGVITMWTGFVTDIPTGWGFCDGTTYNRSDGNGTIQSPNFQGRFVVGAGFNGTNNYSPGNYGGSESVTINVNQLPSHTHEVIDPGHSHNTDRYEKWHAPGGVPNYTGKNGNSIGDTEFYFSSTGITLHPYNGGGQAHENRPKYYVLAYIIKL